MEKQMPVWASVLVIAVVSALLLVSTHLVTQVYALPEGTVGKDSPQGAAMAAAEQFVPVELAADTGLDSCYEGRADGQTVGYVAQATVKGYGGPVELVVGMDMNGALTGISVGGEQFNETPGLGAKAKDAEFTDQFVGLKTPVGLGQGGAADDSADAASSATADASSSATTETPAAATPAAEAASTVDAISGATITSTAVVNGVNQCAEFMNTLLASRNG
jgi:electron transport complex protein RnfG